MASIDDCWKELDLAKDKWERYWKLPYADAYVTAHNGYKKTLNDQAKRDAIAAEVFMFAVTLGIGAGLGALYGKTALKAVALDAAINTVCNRNMDRTFNLMHKVSTSTVGSYLVGAAWDKAGSALTAEVKGKVTKLTSNAPSKTKESIKDPQVFQNSLEAYVLDFSIAAKELLKHLKDCATESTQEMVASSMIAAPFIAKAPSKPMFDVVNTAKDIELGMYMPLIMASDRARSAKGSASTSVGGMGGGYKQWDVKEMTTDRKYPKPYHNVTHTGLLSGLSKHLASGIKYDYLYVDYHRPGGNLPWGNAIMARVNSLHRTQIGGDFEQGSYGKDEIARAEKLNSAIAKNHKHAF